MVKADNKYTKMQKDYYNDNAFSKKIYGKNNYNGKKGDYFHVLLSDILTNKHEWSGKKALDFGCGTGRNVLELLKMEVFERVDGIDISETNINYCNKYMDKKNIKSKKYNFVVNNGIDCQPLLDNDYHFIMSIITLQHICVHEIRIKLLKDIYRILKPKGIFSFQVGYDNNKNRPSRKYFDNFYKAKSTNGRNDWHVEGFENEFAKDLTDIGFKVLSTEIREAGTDNSHRKWYYVRLTK